MGSTLASRRGVWGSVNILVLLFVDLAHADTYSMRVMRYKGTREGGRTRNHRCKLSDKKRMPNA